MRDRDNHRQQRAWLALQSSVRVGDLSPWSRLNITAAEEQFSNYLHVVPFVLVFSCRISELLRTFVSAL